MRTTKTMAVLIVALALGACGNDDADESPGASGPVVPDDVKKAPSLEQARDASGSVTFCAGKDTSGAHKKMISQFNARYAEQSLSADLVEFPPGADEARNQFIQRQRAGDSECDVFFIDVIWPAEFASQGWLMDLTDYMRAREDEFIPSTLAAMQVDGRYWGIPRWTGAGLLYYRTDQVPEPPRTWQELYEQGAANDGYVYQGGSYEGLTVNFLEVAFAAGGEVISEDGTEALIDSPENLEALELMVDGVESGAAPNAVTTYMEEEARRAFEQGRATFMRNWAYAYALGKEAPRVKDRFDVVPLPTFGGGDPAGVLGGNGPVISTHSENPEGAVLLADWMTGERIQRQDAAEFAWPPVLEATYDDPAVRRTMPFAEQLERAIRAARPRPVSVVYPQITQAIYENVNAALSGDVSPEEALANADREITDALASF
jgi:multiple sugar transport system substrate-binding protein